MADLGERLFAILDRHFPPSKSDDATKARHVTSLIFFSLYGGDALGAWNVQDQLAALEQVECGMRHAAEGIKTLSPSIREALIAPTIRDVTREQVDRVRWEHEITRENEWRYPREHRPRRAEKSLWETPNPYVTLTEIWGALKEQMRDAKFAAKAAEMELGRTNWRALTVAHIALRIWDCETGKRAPRTINANSAVPFGVFLQDLFDELGIGATASSALASQRRFRRPSTSSSPESFISRTNDRSRSAFRLIQDARFDMDR